jgi:NTP pyrophosphatase (non-canonical NTP hydrolase)
MSVEKQMPPRWAKDAVASPQGWRHPRTKELLVARRGLVVDEVVEVVEVVEKKSEPVKKYKPVKKKKTVSDK